MNYDKLLRRAKQGYLDDPDSVFRFPELGLYAWRAVMARISSSDEGASPSAAGREGNE